MGKYSSLCVLSAKDAIMLLEFYSDVTEEWSREMLYCSTHLLAVLTSYAYLERTSHDTELLRTIQEIEITTSAFFLHKHAHTELHLVAASDCLRFTSTANMWMQVDTRLCRALMR